MNNEKKSIDIKDGRVVICIQYFINRRKMDVAKDKIRK